jgi:hypothetical protein
MAGGSSRAATDDAPGQRPLRPGSDLPRRSIIRPVRCASSSAMPPAARWIFDLINKIGLTDEDKNKVYYENAKRILKL